MNAPRTPWFDAVPSAAGNGRGTALSPDRNFCGSITCSLVVGSVELGPVQVEPLVVECMGQLVCQHFTHERSDPGPAHHELLRLRVVEPEHAAVEQRSFGLGEVEGGRHETERTQHLLALEQGRPLLCELLVEHLLELAVVRQLHVDVTLELQTPLSFDERLDVAHGLRQILL